MLSFIAVAITFTVKFSVETQKIGGYASDSPEYALYKNTRFQECYDAPVSSTVNCTAKLSSLSNDIPGFKENNVSYMSSGLSKDWCETIGCFKDYKIIPSKPRSSALWPNTLTTWAASAGFIVGSLIQFLIQQKALYSRKSKPCKGIGSIGVISWGLIAFDAVSFGLWWYSFGKLAAAPESASTPFLVGWVIPWKYAGLFRYHPYSCAFRKNRRGKLFARGTFYLIAAVQWAATVYVMRVNLPSGIMTEKWGLRAPNPSYDCVQSQIITSPGTTTCSPEQICSRNWLFVDAGFQPRYGYDNADLGAWLLLLGSTLAAMAPVALAGIVWIAREKSPDLSPQNMFRWADVGPVAVLSALSIFEIIIGCILVNEIVKRLDLTPDAAVNFDWECQAVHVALSPWRFYLDVRYEQGLRLAKMWFNS